MTFQRLRRGFKQFVAAFLVVAAPMIAVAITMPGNYFGRISDVSALSPTAGGDGGLLVHWLRTVAAFASAAVANPNTAVIVDGFQGTDILFLDYAQSPTIFQPGTPIPNPQSFSHIVALTRADLVAAVGETVAQGARPVAWRTSGKPVVWALTP
jgi:hypothetical protein